VIARLNAAESIILIGIAVLCIVTAVAMASDWAESSLPAAEAAATLWRVAGW
jgi:hypothetical protein